MDNNYLMVDDKESLEFVWDALFEVEKHFTSKQFDLVKAAMYEIEVTINEYLEVTEHK